MNLIQKLVEVYKKVDHVEKRGKNTGVGGGYSYMKASDIAHAIRNALQEQGVYAEFQFRTERYYLIERGLDDKGNKKNPMQAVDVRADVTFRDSESGETLTATGLGSGADMGDKAIYKAQTGATKYALRNAFLVPDDSDPESDESTDRATTQTQPARPTPPAPTAKITTPKPVEVPRAEIPNTLTPSAPAAEVLNTPTSNTPAGTITPLSKDEFDGMKKRFAALCEELAKAGLKGSTGKPINRKAGIYLRKTVGLADPDAFSKSQWESFFQVAEAVKTSEGGIKHLVELVNKSNEEAATA